MQDANAPLRLFVALRPPQDVLDVMGQIQKQLSSLLEARWTPRERIHLTPHFLGQVPQAELIPLRSALETAAANTAPFYLHPDQVCLAPPRRPRMVWARYHPHTTFTRLTEDLANLLAPWTPRKPSAREPIPHLTLARFRPSPPQNLSDKLPETPFSSFPVHSLELWQSDLTPRGAHYTSLAHWPLA